MSELKITSVEELLKVKEGVVMELPPFAEGVPFVARVRRPSILKLCESGEISNELLETASGLFMNGGVRLNTKDKKFMPKVLGVLRSLVKQALVEPTYEQLEEVGIELTDEQMMYIFNYVQQGVKSLERFHTNE